MSSTRKRRRSRSLSHPAAVRPLEAFVEGWRSMPLFLVLLRLFLGVTFVYAGVQKLLDPNFLRSGSPDFIGTQLTDFAQGSPIAWLLDRLADIAVLTGIGIATAELAIGLGTLAGIAPGTMAVGGFLVNLALLLSATWHVHPYFLGSDSVYAVAWAAYFVGYLEYARRANAPGIVPGTSSGGRGAVPRHRHASMAAIGRREVLRGATLAGTTIVAGAAAKLLSGTAAAATLAATGAGTAPPMPTPTGSPHAGDGPASPATEGGGSTTSGSAASGAAVPGTPVVELSKVPIGGAIGFQAPGGTPAALVRLSRDNVVAYSRVCTHAGCLVGYEPSQRILFCPCHGAEYDPARGAAVIGGPAPRPLQEIPVEIDRSSGEVVIPE